ncbi:MAG: dicarboxylate/amino acid:cation symporter [Rickettsiales bacterium]|nr:dicarboxylate/amino acid:cation symporter [Rickettsiales bacterium]
MFNLKLWQQIFLGMIIGAIAGLVLGDNATYLKPVGDIFVNMIKMIVVPLIFFSICSAITSMEQSHSLGRIGGKSLLIYLASTAVAIVIGLFLANVFDPSQGITNTELFGSKKEIQPKTVSFSETIVGMIPTNPIKAMAEGNVLQIIVFALFLGTAVNITGKKVKKVADAMSEIAEVIYSLTGIIMKFAPFGVFALIGWVVGTQDPEILKALVKVVIVVISACVLHVILVYSMFIAGLARLNPLTFFKKIIDAQVLAFSTSSSSATLPITMKVAEDKLGVSKGTANFVLPLGSTVNMDGTAIYLGISTVFVAGLVGVDLTIGNYLTVIFTATLASIGAAGIPGVALVMMSMVFASIGLPIEAIAIIAGVDRLLDMVRTTVNVTGDLAISVVIDRSEGTFDQALYDSKESNLNLKSNF